MENEIQIEIYDIAFCEALSQLSSYLIKQKTDLRVCLSKETGCLAFISDFPEKNEISKMSSYSSIHLKIPFQKERSDSAMCFITNFEAFVFSIQYKHLSKIFNFFDESPIKLSLFKTKYGVYLMKKENDCELGVKCYLNTISPGEGKLLTTPFIQFFSVGNDIVNMGKKSKCDYLILKISSRGLKFDMVIDSYAAHCTHVKEDRYSVMFDGLKKIYSGNEFTRSLICEFRMKNSTFEFFSRFIKNFGIIEVSHASFGEMEFLKFGCTCNGIKVEMFDMQNLMIEDQISSKSNQKIYNFDEMDDILDESKNKSKIEPFMSVESQIIGGETEKVASYNEVFDFMELEES